MQQNHEDMKSEHEQVLNDYNKMKADHDDLLKSFHFKSKNTK